MTIHSRVLERRREVAEHRAKRNLGRLFRLLAVAAPMTILVWVAFSPWVSVSRVAIEGAQAASVYEVLKEHRIVMGAPMILLDPKAAEAALEADPWIADATVDLLWPDEVSVSAAGPFSDWRMASSGPRWRVMRCVWDVRLRWRPRRERSSPFSKRVFPP